MRYAIEEPTLAVCGGGPGPCGLTVAARRETQRRQSRDGGRRRSRSEGKTHAGDEFSRCPFRRSGSARCWSKAIWRNPELTRVAVAPNVGIGLFDVAMDSGRR